MKPLKLEIENLRSFRAKREIDFRDLSLCAIVGDTGAGKTSILEAITYALYNRSTWDGRNVKELIANGASAMSVTFTFEVDGAEYTVTRVTRMRGVPSHRLTCAARNIDVSGEEGVRDAILDALHLTADTFLHTVLLPQGKHAELLVARKADRDRMFAELFRLNEIGKVVELAKEQTLRVEAVLGARRHDRAADSGDLEAALAEAQAKVEVATKQLQAAEAAAARVKGLDEQIDTQRQTISALDARLVQLKDVPDLVAELRSLDDIARELAKKATGAKELIETAQASHETVRKAVQRLVDAHLDPDSINGYKVHLTACAAEIRERSREDADLQAAIASLPAKRTTAKEKQGAKAAADRALSDARHSLAQAEERADAERPKVAQFEAAVGRLVQAQEAVNTHTATLEQCSAKANEFQASLEGATSALQQAQREADEARRALEEANVASGAAAIATHLHPGDDCPVCKRKLPADFVPPNDRERDAAERRDTQAREALKKANDRVAKLNAQHESANARIEEARANLATAKGGLKDARAAVPAEALAEPQATLAAMRVQLRSAETAIQGLRGALDAATTAAMTAAHAETTASGEVTTLENRIASLRASVVGRDKTYSTKITQVPDAFRPPTPDKAGIDAAGAKIDEALKVASEALTAEVAAARAVADAQSEAARMDRERIQRVSAPRMKALGLLDRIAVTLSLPGLPEAEKKHAAWVDATEAEAQKETAAAQDVLGAATIAKAKAEEARVAEIAALGSEPSVATRNAAVAKNDAERDVKNAQARIGQRKALDEKIATIEPVYLGVKAVKDELGARRFQAYATEQRQTRLIGEASRILHEMTDNRYAFTKDFEIFDSFTNEARVAETLSGGEKFLTSLALSLAVVEIAANAGAKIGSLFLDEGFATLDSEWVETAMLELRRRARQGRAICVISHLSEVTQFVETTFRVEATVDGSAVTVIHGPMEKDNSAMEGLLSQLATSG